MKYAYGYVVFQLKLVFRLKYGICPGRATFLRCIFTPIYKRKLRYREIKYFTLICHIVAKLNLVLCSQCHVHNCHSGPLKWILAELCSSLCAWTTAVDSASPSSLLYPPGLPVHFLNSHNIR